MGEEDDATATATATESPAAEAATAVSPAAKSFTTPHKLAWTDVLPHTPLVDTFRKCDYGRTNLGSTSSWGTALRLYTSMVFSDSRAACVYWGPDRVAIHNDSFTPHTGGIELMGKTFWEGFPEIFDQFSKIFDEAASTARCIDVDNILLFVSRSGYYEEAYFTGQFIPLRGDSGEIEGFYNAVLESTARVLHERRRKVIQEIAAITPHPVDETLSLIVKALNGNPNDITMAMLYSYDDLDAELEAAGHANLRLRGSIGIPKNHVCAPLEANLETAHSGLIPYFRQAQTMEQPLLLSNADGSLQALEDLLEGIQWVGYGEPSRDLVIAPIKISGTVSGFYVQGICPRREYDENTKMSIVDMIRQIEAKWASSLSAEQGRLRELALETRASESEHRLRHMAQSAPMGMVQITPDYRFKWANDQFYQITGHDPTKPNFADFVQVIAPEDRDDASKNVAVLLSQKTRVEREYRLCRSWQSPVEAGTDAESSHAWIMTSAWPLVEDGEVKYIQGYVTDISHQKWAESVQTRNAKAATQAKRRQEEFIDTTSHEMRNPLTAMTQLADGIRLSLMNVEDSKEGYLAAVKDNIDAANTILACAAHQKRVIDDVLTLSRLESEMLSITPVPERPRNVVEKTIKMFDGECSMQKIKIKARQDGSHTKHLSSYVLLDSSRLMQVLINLLSNAIKFTASAPVREISVVYGVQHERPPRIATVFGNLEWIDRQLEQSSSTALPSGERERFYLYFCVQDTGLGMKPEEMRRLFHRFIQASSRTHIKYGGSGLGLYICRQLAEKQGGAVGVASKHGQGSVFGFYIETMCAIDSELSPEQQQKQVVTRNLPSRTTSNESELPRKISYVHDSTRKEAGEQAQADEESRSRPRPPAISRQASQEKQTARYNILLVEDNLVNQRILAKQLRTANCTVHVANHGMEALEVLEKTDCWKKNSTKNTKNAGASGKDDAPTHIDIILMDWEMPILNGLDCCRRIRELEKEGLITRRLAIIAITANVRQEQMEEAIAAGMDSVMSKPFTTGQLLERVKSTLDERRKSLTNNQTS